MKKKIVHVVIDDKFVDGAISLFETDDRVENTYVIIGAERKCNYIKYPNIVFVDGDKALDFINGYNVVIIHSMPAIPVNIIKYISREVKVVWFAWGFDIYEKPYEFIPIKLFGPDTKKYARLLQLRRLLRISYLRKTLFIKRQMKSILSRIDYFSGVFPYEIDLMKSLHPEFKALPLDFYYGTIDFFIPENPSTEIIHNKHNIIIGNSSNMTANHLEVLDKLACVQIDKEAKIIIPLSYCSSARYISQVESKAEKIAPNKIVALRKYLPLDEYLDLTSKCKAAIFAHERQQASDNIFIQLQYGARVYMSETSAAFAYLKSIGLKVFSIQSELDLITEELSDEDVITNRKILSSYYSSSKLIERVKNINDILIKS